MSKFPCEIADEQLLWRNYNRVFDKYFTDVSVVEGSGTVNGIPLEKGQHFIVPAGYGKCRFEGVMSLICSNPEKH